jgi:hypothetical protein
MEEFQKFRELAKKSIFQAEHILNVTYPMVQDTRLLIGAIENINLSLANAVSSVIAYERQFRRVPNYNDDFEFKYSLFKSKVSQRYKIDKTYLMLMDNVRSIIQKHRESPVEFTRNDKFVICSEGWRIESLSVKQLKDMISKTKEFINSITKITSIHEELFK